MVECVRPSSGRETEKVLDSTWKVDAVNTQNSQSFKMLLSVVFFKTIFLDGHVWHLAKNLFLFLFGTTFASIPTACHWLPCPVNHTHTHTPQCLTEQEKRWNQLMVPFLSCQKHFCRCCLSFVPLSSSSVNEEPQEETHLYVDQLPVSEIIHQVREVELRDGNAKQMCEPPPTIQMYRPSRSKWRVSFRARRRFGHWRY